MATLPLEGVRVLELGHIVAGPSATLILADLGAEVIKVENPESGDTARNQANQGTTYFSFNRNKKSLAVNLRCAEGKEVFRRLVMTPRRCRCRWTSSPPVTLGVAMVMQQTVEQATDRTVQRVLATWAPRMIVQGIDYNDFVSTQARIGTWDDWCREWSKTGAMHAELARQHAERGERLSAGEAFFRAAIAYHFAINNFVHDLDQYVTGHRHKVACYQEAAPNLVPPAERHEVPFGDQVRMPAYLRLPPGRAEKKPPVVVIISGVDSVKEEHKTLEDGFLQRGLATFSFDGPGQGETWFQVGMIVDYERATSAVIDYLAANVPAVDAERVGVFGPSMGGYLAPRSAACDPRIKACAVSGGGYDRSGMREAVLRDDQFQTARLHHLFKISDREALLAALSGCTLEGLADNIRCPLLICHGTHDMVPMQSAERLYAEASGPKQLLVLAGGNHVNNNMPYRYRPAVWDFLRRELSG
jgi:alpha-beta hydrolase superfamily lysophospholipase